MCQLGFYKYYKTDRKANRLSSNLLFERLMYLHCLIHRTAKSGHRRCSVKKSVLRNFTKFTGKHLCQSLLFNKVAGLRPAILLKKRLCHRCFPVNFLKFLRTPFFTVHLRTTASQLQINYKRSFRMETV